MPEQESERPSCSAQLKLAAGAHPVHETIQIGSVQVMGVRDRVVRPTTGATDNEADDLLVADRLKQNRLT